MTSTTSIIGGPAILTFDGATIYTSDDIKVKISKETKERRVSAFGRLDDIFMDVVAEISFKPAQWKDLSKLFPYLSTLPGTKIFGAVAKPLVVQSITEGKKWTWNRAAITALPRIGLGAKKELLGEMTITAIKADATHWSGASAIAAVATSAFADTSFSEATMFDIPYNIAWGSEEPYNVLDSVDGIEITPKLSIEFAETDQGGKLDAWFSDLTFEASFRPVGVTHEQLLAFAGIQGAGVGRGAPLRNFAQDLVISGSTAGDPSVTLHQASVKDSGASFGKGHAAEASTFVCSRRFTTGAPQPIATIGVVAGD